jgi:hypothetical protein
MKNTIKLKSIFQFIFLMASVFTLSACHAPPPAASEDLSHPPIERIVNIPQVTEDGSVIINKGLLVQHIGTEGVFILSAESRARFRMVKAGKRDGEWVTISSGLMGKESILSGPYDSVFDGSPVSVKNTLED